MRSSCRILRALSGSGVASIAAIALAVQALSGDARAQSSASERWTGTWTTAEVGRPQNPIPPTGSLPRPFMVNTRCPAPAVPLTPPPPGQTFAPPPYMHFTNQTLRQIVHSSIGGSKARVVLSNAYVTSPVTIGAASLALREN